MTRALLPVVATALVAVACPVRFDEQTYYDCGRLDDKAVDCLLDDDCDFKMGSKKWTCCDRVCVQDCPKDYRCAADGYCKPRGKACQDGELSCSGYCVPEVRVPEFPRLCCEGCGGGETCCLTVDAADEAKADCRPTQDDRNNCGGCGQNCTYGENCVNGKCLPLDMCDVAEDCVGYDDPLCCDATAGNYGRCSEKNSADAHCGSCERDCTDNNRVCFAGTCITGQDLTCCGRTCTNCRDAGKYCDAATLTCKGCRIGVSPDDCGAGRDCMYVSTGSIEGLCLQQAGSPLPAYGTCTQSATTNPCAPGYACTAFTNGPTLCLQLCRNSLDCVDSGTCMTQAGGWGLCVPPCPCPSTGAPQLDTCVFIVEASACAEPPYCLWAGTVALGQSCGAGNCTSGLSCVALLDGAGIQSQTCRNPCTLDGGCDADAGETCQLPTGCSGVGYCQ